MIIWNADKIEAAIRAAARKRRDRQLETAGGLGRVRDIERIYDKTIAGARERSEQLVAEQVLRAL